MCIYDYPIDEFRMSSILSEDIQLLIVYDYFESQSMESNDRDLDLRFLEGTDDMRCGNNFPAIDNALKTSIKRLGVKVYANLYGLIAAANKIVSEQFDEAITLEEMEKVIEPLRKNFRTIADSNNLTKNDIQKFCEAFNMQSSFAFIAFYPYENHERSPRSFQMDFVDVMNITENMLTLSNRIQMGGTRTLIGDYFLDFKKIYISLKSIGDSLFPEIHTILDEWNGFFAANNPSSAFSEDQLSKFSCDIDQLDILFKHFLDHQTKCKLS